jgi:tetratricopeptide (TPR) repeat protein
LEEAKQLYLQVLAIDVRHAKSLYGLGLIAHQIGNFDAAASMMRRAIAISPNDADYQASLGAVLQDHGRADEAIAAYRQVLRLDPKSEEAHFNLARIFLDQNKLNEANKRSFSSPTRPRHTPTWVCCWCGKASRKKQESATNAHSL